MPTLRRVLIIFFGLMLLFFALALWYQLEYGMDEAEEFEINSPALDRKFVIATQGSDFKDEITRNIINHFKSDSLYIKVIDIASLQEIDLNTYEVMLLIHTWENWQPPYEVEQFIEKNNTRLDNIIVVTTSGEGSSKMDEIDAITGESVTENITPITKQIIEKLDAKLNN